MRQITIISLTLLLISNVSFGQKQGNIWYFGEGAGLDFNSGSPIIITGGQIISDYSNQESSACICDSSGALLFYTEGRRIWNRTHQVMPNGDNLLGHQSASQSSIIVPKPGSDRLFYVFTNGAFQDSLEVGLNYSVVDICADNGLGDVLPTQKNIHLLDTASEKLAVTKHANGIDYWLVTVKHFTNLYYAYKISYSGISSPVITSVGTVYQDSTHGYFAALGQSKFSPDGSKYAVIEGQTASRFAELFDFDNITGVLSNPVSLPVGGGHMYGISFSSNNCKLYLTESYGPTQIDQYDVCAGGGHPDSIADSWKIIPIPSGSAKGMEIGPDGKIYCVTGTTHYIGVINDPNYTYPACNYTHDVIFLDTLEISWGFPSFIANYDYPNTFADCQISEVKEYTTLQNYRLYPNPSTQSTTLEFDNSRKENYTLTLYDSQGHIVEEIINITTSKITIDTKNLNDGLYFFQLHTENQVYLNGKLIRNQKE